MVERCYGFLTYNNTIQGLCLLFGYGKHRIDHQFEDWVNCQHILSGVGNFIVYLDGSISSEVLNYPYLNWTLNTDRMNCLTVAFFALCMCKGTLNRFLFIYSWYLVCGIKEIQLVLKQ